MYTGRISPVKSVLPDVVAQYAARSGTVSNLLTLFDFLRASLVVNFLHEFLYVSAGS
jgi:hypothetical protein